MPIGVNLDKAKEIHKDYMRSARQPLLEALDVQYMLELEKGAGGKPNTIAAQKQALRDVTADPAIAAATTVDELKTVWPEVLGANPLVES